MQSSLSRATRFATGTLVCLAACMSSSSSGPTQAGSPAPAADMSTTPPRPDPRVGLKAGWFDAGEASWNITLLSNTRPSEKFISMSTPGASSLTNSDLAFSGKYAIQGNYSGYQVWDISNPRHPTLHSAYVCPASQSDVSVFRNLLFVSAEAQNGRKDCGMNGVPDSVSNDRVRGIRIFDITDIAHPKYITNVQTCRGSHTHTVVTDPNDAANVYVYISGSANVRPAGELSGCSAGLPENDPNSALFRIEVIKVPLAHPEQAAIVSSPRIFNDLTAPAKHAETPADIAAQQARQAARGAPPRPGPGQRGDPALAGRGPTQCHDITVYPAVGLAGGACGGYGLLLNIHDPAHPVRIGAVADSNFSFWHSATFSNDGSKVLFTDEWGGGSAPRCRTTDKPEWGADALFTIDASKHMTFKSYYKLSAPQTVNENCVAHNGSLIPIPGREVMVQAWYQGGISVFDWTDPSHPVEIAYFDRGPMDSTKLVNAGSWSAYWYNGYIYSSEIARGLDAFQLKPSGFISQNELDAANLVHFDYLNVQDQQRFVWPASFSVARSYLDQLGRNNGLAGDRRAAVSAALATAEKSDVAARRSALTQLATQLDVDARTASDGVKVRLLASAVRDLATAGK